MKASNRPEHLLRWAAYTVSTGLVVWAAACGGAVPRSANSQTPSDGTTSGQLTVGSRLESHPAGIYSSSKRVIFNAETPSIAKLWPGLAQLRSAHGRRGSLRLDRAVAGTLIGTGAPSARISADGAIAYDSWQTIRRLDANRSLHDQGIEPGDRLGVPQVRIRRLRSRRERLLEPGTMSPSWRRDGAIAYVASPGRAYRANRRFLTRVKVRTTPRARPVTWSSLDEYTVLGWAASRLIVMRRAPAEPSELLVFDRQHTSRMLARGAGLVAISPTGSQILISDLSDPATPGLRLLDVASGAVVTTMQLTALRAGSEPAPEWVKGPGDWVGDRIALTTSDGLALLSSDGRTLAVAAVFRSPPSATRSLAGMLEPRFLDRSATRVFAWQTLGGTSDSARRGAQYACDLKRRKCQRHVYPARAVPRPVFDISGG